jgi:AcrR family transcriptional regulator
MTQARRPRADAQRNRARVLAAAREAFATDGPSVSLDDIARRAGVGAGTVHRHFPSKEELFRAVIADRLEELTGVAGDLANAPDPGAAFFDFFHRLGRDAGHNLALSAALTDAGSIGDLVLEAGRELGTALAVLLQRAQAVGAVRSDVDTADLHAMLAGAIVMEQRLGPGAAGRGLAVVADGLRQVGRPERASGGRPSEWNQER